jgi:hypothetical protein
MFVRRCGVGGRLLRGEREIGPAIFKISVISIVKAEKNAIRSTRGQELLRVIVSKRCALLVWLVALTFLDCSGESRELLPRLRIGHNCWLRRHSNRHWDTNAIEKRSGKAFSAN